MRFISPLLLFPFFSLIRVLLVFDAFCFCFVRGVARCLRMGEVSAEKGMMQLQTHEERFLPRMRLRVLLVEPDDSTRQIIAALLRKCSYTGIFFFFIF